MDIDDYTKFSVVLNFPKNSRYSELLDGLSSRTTAKNGEEYAYHLWCSEIDSTHPVYLRVTAHKPSSQHTLRPSESPWLTFRLQIPHHYVLLIIDRPLEKKQLGFLL